MMNGNSESIRSQTVQQAKSALPLVLGLESQLGEQITKLEIRILCDQDSRALYQINNNPEVELERKDRNAVKIVSEIIARLGFAEILKNQLSAVSIQLASFPYKNELPSELRRWARMIDIDYADYGLYITGDCTQSLIWAQVDQKSMVRILYGLFPSKGRALEFLKKQKLPSQRFQFPTSIVSIIELDKYFIGE